MYISKSYRSSNTLIIVKLIVKTFLAKLHQQHEKNAKYSRNKVSASSFIIEHYAGKVSYEVSGFLDKNRDTLQQGLRFVSVINTLDLMELCCSSKNSIVSRLFVENEDTGSDTMRKGRVQTLASQFKVKIAFNSVNCDRNNWMI